MSLECTFQSATLPLTGQCLDVTAKLVWRSNNGVGHINKVKPRRAQLVLGLGTFGGSTVPVLSRPLRPTQPGCPVALVLVSAIAGKKRLVLSSIAVNSLIIETAAGILAVS